MSKVLIISPSGNLYGSEQVLLDFLTYTSLEVEVAVPGGSVLAATAKKTQPRHRFVSFKRERVFSFYLRLLISLLHGRYQTVYLNEAGHSKYLLLLAKLFPKKKFLIHIRLTEDTAKERWLVKPAGNVILISISRYISSMVPFKNRLLYDPYFFNNEKVQQVLAPSPLKIGVIGRIAYSKGVHYLVDLLQYLKDSGQCHQYQFLLFGEFSKEIRDTKVEQKLMSFSNVIIKGFISNKKIIYDSIDCVMHFSDCEPLGRIFFESIDFGKPLIGFNSAGIGEIGSLTGLSELLVDPSATTVPQMANRLHMVADEYLRLQEKVLAQKHKAAKVFSVKAYTRTIESLLQG